MAAQKILLWPHPILQQVAKPIIDFNDDLMDIIKKLSDTMDTEPMAGLAAPQIGIAKRVFAADIPPEQNDGNGTDGKEFFVNPEIILKEGSFSWEEGCMSIPGYKGKVKRAQKIILRYQTETGEQQEREAFDYLSGCFQHELDHLNGILWIDYQSQIKKSMIKKKMLKLKELPYEKQRLWKENP